MMLLSTMRRGRNEYKTSTIGTDIVNSTTRMQIVYNKTSTHPCTNPRAVLTAKLEYSTVWDTQLGDFVQGGTRRPFAGGAALSHLLH